MARRRRPSPSIPSDRSGRGAASLAANRRLPPTLIRRNRVLALADLHDSASVPDRTPDTFPAFRRAFPRSYSPVPARTALVRPVRPVSFLSLMRPTVSPQVERAARVCVRRKSRREVLFSVRVAGRSGGSPGKRGTYRRTLSSQLRCS